MRRVIWLLSSVVLVSIAAGTAQESGGSAWPRRPLMEAPYEDSLDARYVSKPVLDSLVVDDMETNHDWTISGIGKMTYIRVLCWRR